MWTFKRDSNVYLGLGSGVCVECYVMNDRVHVVKFQGYVVTSRDCYCASVEFHILGGDAYSHGVVAAIAGTATNNTASVVIASIVFLVVIKSTPCTQILGTIK